MKKDNLSIHELREQIIKGLHLTFKKLVEEKKARNGVLVVFEEGEIKKIKAVDLNQ